MDYVDGSDTAQLLHHSPNGLPTTDVCELACAVADAIDYAHGNGLLHRDIKPSNVLVSQRKAGKRRILLTDFGIARRLDDISGLTATNMTVGTVNYAAPERSIQRHRGDSHTQHGKHFGAAPVEQGFGVSSACQAR